MEKMKIATRRRRIRWTVFIAVAAFLMPNIRLMAKQKKRTHTTRRTHMNRRQRRSRHYRHYLHVRIQPARVREIQEALVKAGFLHDTPDGIWGPSTRDAMKQFQKQHGFSPTGLPEAKPLMLLGLGPHPLPPGLLPSPHREADTESASEDGTEARSVSAAPPVNKPVSSN
jgi:peptidoglycan hydrolase-like protein with peptidoglycan-binding domain